MRLLKSFHTCASRSFNQFLFFLFNCKQFDTVNAELVYIFTLIKDKLNVYFAMKHHVDHAFQPSTEIRHEKVSKSKNAHSLPCRYILLNMQHLAANAVHFTLAFPFVRDPFIVSSAFSLCLSNISDARACTLHTGILFRVRCTRRTRQIALEPRCGWGWK